MTEKKSKIDTMATPINQQLIHFRYLFIRSVVLFGNHGGTIAKHGRICVDTIEKSAAIGDISIPAMVSSADNIHIIMSLLLPLCCRAQIQTFVSPYCSPMLFAFNGYIRTQVDYVQQHKKHYAPQRKSNQATFNVIVCSTYPDRVCARGILSGLIHAEMTQPRENH